MDRKLTGVSVMVKPLLLWLIFSALCYFFNSWVIIGTVRAKIEQLFLTTGGVGTAMMEVVKWPVRQLAYIHNGVKRIADLEARMGGIMVTTAQTEMIKVERDAALKAASIPVPPSLQKIGITRMIHTRNQWRLKLGAAAGITPGMSVIDEAGAALGRIGSTGTYTSEVVPFYNQNFQVEVEVVGKSVTGWLRGDGTVARITDVPQTTPINSGDIVVTSGGDDLLAPGLVVGQITTIESKPSDVMQTALVELSGNANGLVMVVQ